MPFQEEPLEIERKFLIRYPDLSLLEKLCERKAGITQTYLQSEPGKTRRVRKMVFGDQTEYWYTEKEKITDVTRIEREQNITEAKYEELLKDAIPGAGVISKTRYFLPYEGLCLEIDIFPEWKDRAFAEAELKEENQEIRFPEFIRLIREVTEDPRYTNSSLARNGFPFEEI